MSKDSDLKTRLIVGLILIGLAMAALWVGGFGFWLVVSVMGILMAGEWADLMQASTRGKRLSQYVLSVPLAILCPLAAGPGFFALGLIFAGFLFVAIATRDARLAAGQLYVGFPVLALLLLRAHPHGFAITFWTMAVVWACDSGAYFAGRAIGGPRLAPAISPNKTWAGFIGGLAATIIFTFLFLWLDPAIGMGWSMVLISPLLGLFSQLGDLFESHLKRVAGVKDSGILLPGHGGILDRLDGLVFAAPVAALFFAPWHPWAGGFWW